jgi:hypothetical protein
VLLVLRTIRGVCSPCNIIVGVHIFKICERGVNDGVMFSLVNAKGNEDGTLPIFFALLAL